MFLVILNRKNVDSTFLMREKGMKLSRSHVRKKAPRFVTLTVVVGEWSDSSSGRFAAGKELPVPNDKEASWFPESVWAW